MIMVQRRIELGTFCAQLGLTKYMRERNHNHYTIEPCWREKEHIQAGFVAPIAGGGCVDVGDLVGAIGKLGPNPNVKMRGRDGHEGISCGEWPEYKSCMHVEARRADRTPGRRKCMI